MYKKLSVKYVSVITTNKARVNSCQGCPVMGQDTVACIKLNNNQILAKNINLEYLADMKKSAAMPVGFIWLMSLNCLSFVVYFKR